ncbi:MAG: family 16 glycosylhydrolase [Bacteroidota bacterium]
MKRFWTILIGVLYMPLLLFGQTVIQDDFEGNGTISTWYADDCLLNTELVNPYQNDNNSSATVLEYQDVGGTFANIGFDLNLPFNLNTGALFTFKIYVPSNGLTGSQANQVSLKLQNKLLEAPWSTQSEVIKPIQLDQWQTVSFDFLNDPYINLNAGSPPPIERRDFYRVVIQVNGENNTDHVLAYLDDFFYSGTFPEIPVYDNLIWSDEFEVDGAIDSDKWWHQTIFPNGDSWFNGEIQHYTDRIENSSVQNGELKITLKKETYIDQGTTRNYTSARLNSKFAFQYGRVEVRAKLPTGVGTWPAIWMLGKNVFEPGAWWTTQGFGTTHWPACGEIDIMEHWGDNQDYISSAMHTPSSFGATSNLGGRILEGASDDYHVYEMIWSEDRIIFSVDSAVHYVYDPEIKNASTWPFDAEQYILLNVAVLPIIEAGFTESSMDIDYVRVYQESPVTSIEAPTGLAARYFPNPVTEVLNIQLNAALDGLMDLQVVNTLGQQVRTARIPVVGGQAQLAGLKGLPIGSYAVQYELDGQSGQFLFVKK